MTTNPVRIVQVFGIMNRGGAENMIMNLYRNIDRSAYQFDFVVHRNEKGSFDDEIRKMGGRIYVCPKYSFKNHFLYKRWWHQFFKNHTDIQIVHSHVRSTASIYLRIAKKYDLKTIAHSHSVSNGKSFSSLIKFIFQLSICKHSDILLACSTNAGKWLFGKNVCENKKFFVLKNAIDLSKFIFSQSVRTEMRQSLELNDKMVFVHVGRFHKSKNHSFLLRLFSRIDKSINNARLILVGTGSLFDKIKKKSEKYGLQNKVIFVGTTDCPENYLNASDCFLFPSKWEGLGLSVIEAEANGLKCICSTNVPQETKIIDKCFYISTKRIDCWAEKAIQVDLDREKDYSMEIKKSGYNVKDTSEQLMSIYGGLLNE